ncbi:MAG: response regulator [Bradymonadaceae bacterium]
MEVVVPGLSAEESLLSIDTEGEIPRILIVDDEVHILKAVQRLFMGSNYEIATANSGEIAIEKLGEKDFAVIISDQRMPGLSGAALLKYAHANHPNTVRIMLTGNNDVATAIEAINHGEVFRFVAKPWEHDTFLRVVEAAVEQHELLVTRSRYEQFIQQQNLALQELIEDLEERVVARTSEIEANQNQIQELYQRLQDSFDSTIKALLSIMELGDIHIVEHCHRTAERVRLFAEYLQIEPDVARNLERAALLHWIGLINAPGGLFSKPLSEFDAVERANWEFHPILAQQAIYHVPALEQASKIIVHYLRRYDDVHFRPGQPISDDRDESFDGNTIICCRILSICSAYERVRTRHRRSGAHSESLRPVCEEAIQALKSGSGTLFDPELVQHFVELIGEEWMGSRDGERLVPLDELLPAMVLSRPLETIEGIPVAPRDMIVTEELVERLKRFKNSHGLSEVFIWA